MKKITSATKLILRSVSYVIKGAPVYALIYIFCLLLNSFMNGISAPVNQKLYDAIERFSLGNEVLKTVILCAVLVVSVVIVRQLIDAMSSILDEAFRHATFLKLEVMMNKKISRLPLVIFENKRSLDNIEKANAGVYGLLDLFTALVRIVFYYMAYFAIMGVYLCRIKPILLVSLLLVFVPFAVAQVMQARIYTNIESELAPLRRMEDSFYFHSMDVRETRLFGVFHHFHELRKDVVSLMHRKELTVQKKITKINIALNFIKISGWIAIVALLFDALVKKEISIGGFSAVFTSISAMFSNMEGVFNVIKRNITNKFGMIGNFMQLMDMEEDTGEEKTPDYRRDIVADHISFTYPNMENQAVKNVSLTIHAGETVAFVGENGSGKTTLSKLLLGLYKPDTGAVFVGECDTAKTAGNDLFAKSSAVFQNFKSYGILTLSDNVRVGDFRCEDSTETVLADSEVDYSDTKTFPSGVNTVMSREFGGIDISKGQWQRVAMARGLYRKHQFIILDEPTASIDPLEETRIYKRFAEIAKNKTVLLITHRLGSARIADRIVVMDHGNIVEVGTHEDLLKKHGKYAEMWELQASGYQQ